MKGTLAPGMPRMQMSLQTKVYLWCAPTDMRKGFDGLSALASKVVKMDPFSGHLFLFRSRQGDYLKVLHWDGSGICLFSKRLEQGNFVWPPQASESLHLTAAQLALLIEGMDWRRTHAPRVTHGEAAVPVIL